jgi:hypothetical protein
MTIKLMRLKLSITHQVITLLRELIEVIEQINEQKLLRKLIWEWNINLLVAKHTKI